MADRTFIVFQVVTPPTPTSSVAAQAWLTTAEDEAAAVRALVERGTFSRGTVRVLNVAGVATFRIEVEATVEEIPLEPVPFGQQETP